ncbi:hypothetical protein [Peribacillus simplex]|uniref:hypothetical protein n=1 Tax=Peribacillus simplex TaxID=1478 RepID=UPI00366F7F8C
MRFPIVSCETLKKLIGPVIFSFIVKGSPISLGSERYASNVWYATMWLAFRQYDGFD